MPKRAIIYDLDNTIYAVASIADKLFASLFQTIEKSGVTSDKMVAVKDDVMRKPFQLVARHHQFSEALTKQCLDLLTELTYDDKIATFTDYPEIKTLPVDRFLVTTGFTKLQHSKIKSLGIEPDFKEIHVIDPQLSAATKRNVFEDIMKRHGYTPAEILVVGDDPESEIKAARELGIDSVLYDKNNRYQQPVATHKITDFKALRSLL